MRLIFTKEANGDIKSQIHTGTVLTDFSYSEMVKQLLQSNVIEGPEFNGLEEEEESKIQKMLDDISCIFEVEETNDIENTESSQTE